MTYYIIYKTNTIFDTSVDAGVIPNPALDRTFLLMYPLLERQLLLEKHYSR